MHAGADRGDEAEAELTAIEQELDAIGAKERVYRPDDIGQAGAAISLGSDGTLRVERGYLRPEDEEQPETASGIFRGPLTPARRARRTVGLQDQDMPAY